MRIAVIGVGLIGGSIALAARERLGADVAGHDRDPAALNTALDRGAITSAHDSIAAAVAGASAAFIAVPLGAQRAVLCEALAAAPADCVVSDVGSTKREVVAASDDQRFVGGHPLAGAETSGIAHARADLFDGATWYLTPTRHTSGIRYEGAAPDPQRARRATGRDRRREPRRNPCARLASAARTRQRAGVAGGGHARIRR